MIIYLIKNNFKIMFRNSVNIFMFVLCPIITSAVLISAFSALLESYESVSSFEVGYIIEDESDYTAYIDKLVEVGKDNGVTFTEYKSGAPKKLVDENELGGFVEFNKDGYTVYESEDKKVEGTTLEYMMSAFFNSAISDDTSDISLNVKSVDHIAPVNSTDYYGIIYIVYYGWCAIVCAAGLLSNEKKNRINERLKVSNLSSLQIYLAKLIPIVMVVALGIGTAGVITAFLLGVHWGNLAISIPVVLLMIIAASAMELMIYEISFSMIGTIIITFGVVWVMGFIGGSFETYMFSGHPETLKMITPIYHGNRALVELSVMGHSDYVTSSIVYSLMIAVVCSAIAVFIGKMRRSLKNG